MSSVLLRGGTEHEDLKMSSVLLHSCIEHEDLKNEQRVIA